MDLPVPASPPGVLKISSPTTQEYWEVPVLHCDEHLLALDKPPGLPSSPDRMDPERPNLVQLIHAHIARGVPWAKQLGLSYIAAAHRLDSDTSGVILLARSKDALSKLANQFGADLPARTWLALVQGTPEQSEFEVDARLAPHPLRPGVMRVDRTQGKRSLTRFRVIERFVGCTLVECRPVTSRPQQVRAHLWWVKCPVMGDRVYAGKPLWLSEIKPGFRPRRDRPERPLLARPALHAASLEVTHPISGVPLRLESALPRDLAVALKYLRRYAFGAGSSIVGIGPGPEDWDGQPAPEPNPDSTPASGVD